MGPMWMIPHSKGVAQGGGQYSPGGGKAWRAGLGPSLRATSADRVSVLMSDFFSLHRAVRHRGPSRKQRFVMPAAIGSIASTQLFQAGHSTSKVDSELICLASASASATGRGVVDTAGPARVASPSSRPGRLGATSVSGEARPAVRFVSMPESIHFSSRRPDSPQPPHWATRRASNGSFCTPDNP